MARIFFDGKTKAEWLAANPILGDGELVYETDTRKIQVGDGVKTYSELLPTCGYRSYVAIIETGSTDEGLEPVVIAVLEDTIGITGLVAYSTEQTKANMLLSNGKFIADKTTISISTSSSAGSCTIIEPQYMNANAVRFDMWLLTSPTEWALDKVGSFVVGFRATVEVRVYE